MPGLKYMLGKTACKITRLNSLSRTACLSTRSKRYIGNICPSIYMDKYSMSCKDNLLQL